MEENTNMFSFDYNNMLSILKRMIRGQNVNKILGVRKIPASVDHLDQNYSKAKENINSNIPEETQQKHNSISPFSIGEQFTKLVIHIF